MIMSREDILLEYRQAKNPSKQITILADENGCSRKEIVEVLREAGAELPKYYMKAAAPKEDPERKVLEDEGLLYPAPNVGEILLPAGERVAWAAVDVIAKLLKDADARKDQEDAEYCFKENVRGVLAMVHTLTDTEEEK